MQSEEASSKRQRVSQACDWCRKKKIRCDGTKPTCTTCRNAGFNCVYTKTARKPRTVKKKASVNDLEHRLDRLESLLQSIVPAIKGRKRRHQEDSSSEESEASASESEEYEDSIDQPPAPDAQSETSQSQYNQALHPEDDSDSCLRDENIPVSSHFITIRPGEASRKPGAKKDMFQATMEKDVEHFFSNSSVLSIFSSSGMQWVTSKTGDETIGPRLTKVLTEIHRSHQAQMRQYVENDERPEMPEQRYIDFALNQLREATVFKELITDAEIQSILDSLHGRSETPCGYAETFFLFSLLCFSLIIVASIPEQRARLGMSLKEVYKLQDRFYKGALYYFNKIFLLGSSLLSVKALILLTVSFQFTDTKRRFDPLEAITPVAVQFAYDLGLHRDESCVGLSEADANNRRMVWWFIYSLDRDVAMKNGKSPTILDFDVSMKLPTINPTVLYGPLAAMPQFDTDFDFFSSSIKLYRISGLVYEKLFSAQGGKKSPAEIVRDISYLDGELAKWLDELPAQFRPGAEIPDQCVESREMFDNSPRYWFLKCTFLHVQFVYNHLLSTIHRITAYHPSWIYATLSGENSNSASPLAMPRTEVTDDGQHSAGQEDDIEKRRGASKSSPSIASTGSTQQFSANGVATGTSSSTPAHTPTSLTSIKLRGIQSGSKYARLFTSMDICVHSARSTIELARMTKEWDQSFWWGSLYFLFNSFITLFIKCIARPKDLSTQYDLDLLHMVMGQFDDVSKGCTGDDGGYITHLLTDFWSCLCSAARAYVEQSNNGKSPTNSSSANNNTSVGGKQRKRPVNATKRASARDDSTNSDGASMPPPVYPQEDPSMPQYADSALPREYHVPMENSTSQFPPQPHHNHHHHSQHPPQHIQHYPFDMGLNGNAADANVAQSLYNMSNIFFSWDTDFVWNPMDFPMATAPIPSNGQSKNGGE